jgi:hypothetical protein
MSMYRLLIGAALLISVASGARADSPNLGRPVSPEEAAAWDISNNTIFHYNGITSWGVTASGELTHVYV